MKITVAKLITGEEVIGVNVTSDHENLEVLKLEKARTLIMQQTEKGEVGLGMIPFMAAADNPGTGTESAVTIRTSAIIAEVDEVPKVLEDAFLRTTSGIAI